MNGPVATPDKQPQDRLKISISDLNPRDMRQQHSHLKGPTHSATQVQLPAKLPEIPTTQEPILHEESIDVVGNSSPAFLKPSPYYERQVELWKIVYGRITTNQMVFYHREHPELPFYSIAEIPGLSDEQIRRAGNSQRAVRQFERLNKIQTERRERENLTENFRKLEKKVGDPNTPRDPWERRIENAFKMLPGGLEENLRDARGKTVTGGRSHIRAQTGVANWVEDALHRAQRWVPQMADVLDRNDLPPQLLAIPLIEGLFQERIVSRARAVGPWQFLSSTARINGLMVNASVDERRDPVLSTAAAARYFESARKTVQNACDSIGVTATEEQLWPLVITAYNRGAAGMARVIRQTKSCDLEQIVKDENDKRFGIAVKSYWPAFLAAIDILTQPQDYFASPASPLEPESGEVFKVDSALRKTTLERNLRRVGMTYQEFLKLNPAVSSAASVIPSNARIRLPAALASEISKDLPIAAHTVR